MVFSPKGSMWLSFQSKVLSLDEFWESNGWVFPAKFVMKHFPRVNLQRLYSRASHNPPDGRNQTDLLAHEKMLTKEIVIIFIITTYEVSLYQMFI